eukprot:186615_1
MGNKCLGSSNKEKLSQDDLEPILAIDPQDWTQGQVIKWLQLTHDGDLRDLIDPFKAQKISGVTFVKLSEENLKNDLEIKQFGLRDGFISARNKLLQQSKQNKLKPTPQQPSQTQTQAAPQQPSNANINTTPNDPNHEQDSLNAHKDMPIAQSVPIQNPLDQNTKPMVIDSESNEQLAISNPNPNPMSTEDVNHQHQHTSSNNHLITKPVNPRLNSSFDNPTDSMPNHAMSPLSGSNLNNTNPIPTNTSNVVVNGGYEVIPDILSPHSQGNAGFKNMPDDAFKDGPLQPPDDNYAQIDFADLHHTDAVPSIAPHLIPNGHSVHNAAYGVNGYPTGPGGAPPTQLYQMNSYQSNHVPFGQIQSMQTMPAMGAHPGHAHAHHHHHNQTGSNYDELPLEFIHNIPNAPNDASQQAMSGMSGMSGYQAIEFNDTLHDDNRGGGIYKPSLTSCAAPPPPGMYGGLMESNNVALASLVTQVERGDRLECLEDKSVMLSASAQRFSRSSKKKRSSLLGALRSGKSLKKKAKKQRMRAAPPMEHMSDEDCYDPTIEDCYGKMDMQEEEEHMFVMREKMVQPQLYQEMESTKAYQETYWYKYKYEQDTKGLIPLNKFWCEYAQYLLNAEDDIDLTFLSKWILLATSNIHDIICALTVLNLSFQNNGPQYEYAEDGNQLTLKCQTKPSMVFIKQLVIDTDDTQTEKQETISVHVSYFDPLDDCEYGDDGERYDKFISPAVGTFYTLKMYSCVIVLTNVSSMEQNLKLLVEIPSGSIPC